jgi:hypothetical protein
MALARTVVKERYQKTAVRPVFPALPGQELIKAPINASLVSRVNISQLLLRLLALLVILKEDNTKRRRAQHTAKLPNRDRNSMGVITQKKK